MSSKEYEHSSSSPVSHNENRREPQRQRSRSRSREKHRHRQDREQNRGKGQNRKRQKVVRVPQLNSQLVNFRTFLTYQPDKIPKDVAQRQYQIYKAQWQQKANKAFFIQHKNDAWFQQKYNPQVLDAMERQRKQRIIKISNQFINAFKDGYYDDIDLSIKQYNQLGFVSNQRDQQFQEFKDITNNNTNQSVPINFQTIDLNVSPKININTAPFYAFDPDANTMFIKAIPRNISKFDIFSAVGKLQGFQTITLSEPLKKLHFSRYCWITFANQQCLKKAQLAMNGLTIKDEPIAIGSSSSRSRRVKILKNYPTSRINTDADVVKRLAMKLDQQCGVTGNILMQTEFSSKKKQFDTFLLYLRRVHAHDYYSSTSYPNQRALCLKLGRIFLRIQADYEQNPAFQTVFKKMHNAAQNIILKGTQTPDHLNKLKQQVQKMIVKHISQSQQNTNVSVQAIKQRTIWQCTYCNKKFKTCQFVAKHIIMKHDQAKDKHIHVIMEQAYNLDPHKIVNYGKQREDRGGDRGRRQGGYGGYGYKRGRGRQYRDLDDPQNNQMEKGGAKGINFLDI